MNITFYDDRKNRTWSYNNVNEVITRPRWVDVKCIEPNGAVFRTRVLTTEYNRLEIERD